MADNLHCGACMTDMETTEELSEHLKTCPAVKALHFPIVGLYFFDADNTGHPLAHLIASIHRYAHLIKRYAHAVADDMPTLQRANLHHELCKCLDLDHRTFKPFESEDITSIPTREEAEKILWDALGDVLRDNMCMRKGD